MTSLGLGYPLYTLYYLVKYFDKKNNYVVLKIDNYGIFLCPNRNENVFISWEKIKYVTFVVDFYGSKIAILQYNKKSHYMSLTEYFFFLLINFTPRSAIKAAYKYADNIKKIKEVKADLLFNYENGIWDYYIKK